MKMKKRIKIIILFIVIITIGYWVAKIGLGFFLDKTLVNTILKWGVAAQIFMFGTHFIIEYLNEKIN